MPVRAAAIVVSTQHTFDMTSDEVRELVEPYVRQALPEEWIDNDTAWARQPDWQIPDRWA